jgi:hypothetical protein
VKPTKQFERWLSVPSLSKETIKDLEQYECDVCRAELVHEWCRFFCTLPHPERHGLREYWHKLYDVCPDCADAGAATFPDRLRKHADELEGRARELRKLVDAKWWQPSIPDATNACKAANNALASP